MRKLTGGELIKVYGGMRSAGDDSWGKGGSGGKRRSGSKGKSGGKCRSGSKGKSGGKCHSGGLPPVIG